jgi:hypothetical protein
LLRPSGLRKYLEDVEDVGFFMADEKTAFGAAWGFLSRVWRFLLLKSANWKANGFNRFS